MKLVYTMKKGHKPDSFDIKTCDEASKAMKTLLVETAKVANWKIVPLMWILTRFVKRTITDKTIEYDYYLVSN